MPRRSDRRHPGVLYVKLSRRVSASPTPIDRSQPRVSRAWARIGIARPLIEHWPCHDIVEGGRLIGRPRDRYTEAYNATGNSCCITFGLRSVDEQLVPVCFDPAVKL